MNTKTNIGQNIVIEKGTPKCKCGLDAVKFRPNDTIYACPSITAYPCDYSRLHPARK